MSSPANLGVDGRRSGDVLLPFAAAGLADVELRPDGGGHLFVARDAAELMQQVGRAGEFVEHGLQVAAHIIRQAGVTREQFCQA